MLDMGSKSIFKCLKGKLKKKKTNKHNPEYSCLFKVVLLGSEGVGKTSLFEKARSTMNVENCNVANDGEVDIAMHCDSVNVTLRLIDVSGQVDFPVRRRSRILEADAFVLVFSLAEQESLRYLMNLRKNIQAITGKDLKDLPVVVIGNKNDLEHGDTLKDIVLKQCLNEMDSPVIQCSAKDDVNVLSIFQILCDELGIYGAIYEKVFEIQCREEFEKANKKAHAARTKSV